MPGAGGVLVENAQVRRGGAVLLHLGLADRVKLQVSGIERSRPPLGAAPSSLISG